VSSRREFLQFAASFSLSSAFGNLVFSSEPGASGIPSDGYKAIVCIMLHGGNDSFNMVVPTDNSGYTGYRNARGHMSIPNIPLGLPDALPSANDSAVSVVETEDAYYKGLYWVGSNLGVNALMPELAHLIKDGRAKVVANVGTLNEPTDKQKVIDKAVTLPLMLFAHNHQQRQLYMGRADIDNGIGWTGHLADKWLGGFSYDFPIGVNISLQGNTKLMLGNLTSPFVMRPSGPEMFQNMRLSQNALDGNPNWGDKVAYNRRALFKYMGGRSVLSEGTGTHPEPLDFTQFDPYAPTSILKQAYQFFSTKSLDILGQMERDWATFDPTYTSKDLYGNPIFSIADESDPEFILGIKVKGGFGRFISQLRAIARLIKMGSEKGYGRQIFYAQLGGFDTHSQQERNHPGLLRELSLGIHHFYKALEELSLADNVMTYTQSDFGRTLSNNGDGTDHGWGGHSIVMGPNLSTGALAGRMPDLWVDSQDDYYNKGRIIPQIAQEQINAAIASWFGVTNPDIEDLFPNLAKFKTSPQGDISTAFVEGVFA